MNPKLPSNLDIEQIKKYAASPEGRLFSETIEQSNPEIVQKAKTLMQNGEYEKAAGYLKELMASPEINQLIQTLRGNK